MKDSSSFNLAQNASILVVGDPGSGKSRLALAFPDPGILDCGGNLGSAVRVAKDKKFKWSQPMVYDDKEPPTEVPEELRWTRAVEESKKLLVHPDVKTFVIDDFSNLCRWGLVHCEHQLKLAGVDVKKDFFAKYTAFIPLLTNFVTMIRIPKKMVVVTVHQVVDKEEVTGRVRYFLDIPGRLAQNLAGQFTDCWGMESKEDSTNTKYGAKYSIRTKPSGYHVNLKTSLDLEPSIDITGKTPAEIWTILAPKLSINLPPKTT